MRMAIFASVVMMSGTAAAQPTGTWRTPIGGEVTIEACGKALCGRLVSSPLLKTNPDLRDQKNPDPNLRDRRLKGIMILTSFTGGPTKWSNGRIYNAEDGRTYSGSIALVSPTTLTLRGCLVAFLCRSQTWTRIR